MTLLSLGKVKRVAKDMKFASRENLPTFTYCDCNMTLSFTFSDPDDSVLKPNLLSLEP